MKNLRYHFPICYAYSVKEPIGELNLKRALDEARSLFFLLFPSFIFFSTGSYYVLILCKLALDTASLIVSHLKTLRMNYLVRIWSMEYVIVAYAGAMKVTLETTVKHVPPLRLAYSIPSPFD